MSELVIDTATEALSLALFTDGACVARHHEILGRGHAERLVPAMASFPLGGRAAHITVDVGPGSFTGVRVGIAAARALAFAWGSTLSSYSALTMVAAMARARTQSNESDTIAVVLTGGHGELFWQRFDAATLLPVTDPASMAIAALAGHIEENHVFGSGAEALIAARGWGEAHVVHPEASCRSLLAPTAIRSGASPLYGRGADATPSAKTASAL